MFNIFKRKDKSSSVPGMGLLHSLAMKKLASMSEKDRMKLMQRFITPENIQKNKNSILQTIETMKASGQLSAAQAEEAKKRLGI